MSLWNLLCFHNPIDLLKISLNPRHLVAHFTRGVVIEEMNARKAFPNFEKYNPATILPAITQLIEYRKVSLYLAGSGMSS